MGKKKKAKKESGNGYEITSLALQGLSLASNHISQQRQLDLQEELNIRAQRQVEERERLQRLLEGYEGYKERILKLLELHRWEEASNACDEAIRQFIQSRGDRALLANENLVIADTYHLSAMALFYSHQFERADEKCKEALKLDAKNSDYLILKSKIAMLLGRIDNASESFQNALNLTSSPERRLILKCYIAFLSWSTSNVIDKVKLCQKANLVFEDEALLAMQGWAYFSQQQYIAAAVSFKQAIHLICEISPLNSDARHTEIQVLRHFIGICLSMRLLFDKNTALEIRTAIKNNLIELIKLWQDYKKRTKNTSLTYTNPALQQYPCFITCCLFDYFVEELEFQGRKFLSGKHHMNFVFASEDLSELAEKLSNETSESTNYSFTLPFQDKFAEPTLGDGDCAFHAIFGKWNEAIGMYVCQDVMKKRKEVATKCRNSKPGEDIYTIMWEEIKNLIMDENISLHGNYLKQARKNYQAFEAKSNNEIETKWEELQSLFSREIKEYINNSGFEGYFKEKFHKCLNNDTENLMKFLSKSAELKNKFNEYNAAGKNAIKWDDILKSRKEIQEEYLQERIEKLGTYLTPLEIQLIAYAFDIKIQLWTKAKRTATQSAKADCAYNENGRTEVSIQFDGVNHFERRKIVSKTEEAAMVVLEESEPTVVKIVPETKEPTTVVLEKDEPTQINSFDKEISPTLFFHYRYLSQGFEADPYDPANLLLLSALDTKHVPKHIQYQAQVAKAHLAYCYLHAYRVQGNYTKAIALANSHCIRGKAEYGFIKWQGFKGKEKIDIKKIKEFFEKLITSEEVATTTEFDGRLRVKLYYALFLLKHYKQNEESESMQLLKESAFHGVILAQAWLANIYAFGLYGIEKNSKLAQKWLIRAMSNTNATNKPDYFFACLVHSWIHREGVAGYSKNLAKTRDILLAAITMGSVECMVELGMLYWSGFIHHDGSECRQSSSNATEEDRAAAMLIWEKATQLGFNSRRESEDRNGYWAYKNYGTAILYEQFVKKSNQKLAKNFFEECIRISARFAALDQEYIYYCLGLLHLFASDAEVYNEDTAIRYLKLAANNPAHDNSTYRSNIRALARLTAIAPQRQDALVGVQVQNINLPLTENLTLRPSIAANASGNIVLMYKDQFSQRIKIKLGKIKKEDAINWYFAEVNSPFEGNNYEHGRVAINSNNIVVCSSYCTGDRKIHYRIGRLEGQNIIWSAHQDNNVYTHSGTSPVIALNDDGIIMEAHCYDSGGYLYHRLGRVNQQNVSIEWFSLSGTQMSFTNDAQVRFPSLAMKNNQIIIAWKSGINIQYRMGTLNNQTIQWSAAIQNLNFPYMTPYFLLDTNRVLLFAGGMGNDDGLYYREGQINGPQITWNNAFENYDVGYWPTAIINNDQVFAFHEFDCGLNKSRICRRDIPLYAPQQQAQPGEHEKVGATQPFLPY